MCVWWHQISQETVIIMSDSPHIWTSQGSANLTILLLKVYVNWTYLGALTTYFCWWVDKNCTSFTITFEHFTRSSYKPVFKMYWIVWIVGNVPMVILNLKNCPAMFLPLLRNLYVKQRSDLNLHRKPTDAEWSHSTCTDFVIWLKENLLRSSIGASIVRLLDFPIKLPAPL